MRSINHGFSHAVCSNTSWIDVPDLFSLHSIYRLKYLLISLHHLLNSVIPATAEKSWFKIFNQSFHIFKYLKFDFCFCISWSDTYSTENITFNTKTIVSLSLCVIFLLNENISCFYYIRHYYLGIDYVYKNGKIQPTLFCWYQNNCSIICIAFDTNCFIFFPTK